MISYQSLQVHSLKCQLSFRPIPQGHPCEKWSFTRGFGRGNHLPIRLINACAENMGVHFLWKSDKKISALVNFLFSRLFHRHKQHQSVWIEWNQELPGERDEYVDIYITCFIILMIKSVKSLVFSPKVKKLSESSTELGRGAGERVISYWDPAVSNCTWNEHSQPLGRGRSG